MSRSEARLTIFFFGTMVFLLSSSVALGQEGVFVNPFSIEQNLDFQRRLFVVSGTVENSLPLGVCNVLVRLYVPGPEATNANIWEINLVQIGPYSTVRFVFRMDPRELVGYKTFAVRVWQYDLDTKNINEVLGLAQKPNPPVLRAVVRALVRLTRSQPNIVQESFTSSTRFGRLCLTEAVLSNTDPKQMQYLAERLLAGQEVIDKDLLREISILANLISEPFPFPQIERWNLTGNPQADVAKLIRVFPAGGIPMVVRMRYIGTSEGRQFAENHLQASNMENFEQQFAVDDSRARHGLISVYRELAYLSPKNMGFRYALGTAELRVNSLFIVLAIVVSVVVPCILAWRTRRT